MAVGTLEGANGINHAARTASKGGDVAANGTTNFVVGQAGSPRATLCQNTDISWCITRNKQQKNTLEEAPSGDFKGNMAKSFTRDVDLYKEPKEWRRDMQRQEA